MSAFYSDEQVKVYQMDVLEWALDYKARIDADKVLPMHAIVTDCPYGLSDPPPIEKVLTAWLADGDFDYKKNGFMGKSWDNLPPSPRYWRALLNVCYPGAYLFAFSGTRTADLMGISCRLGGWEPFDRVMHWAYGSGFPKSHAIGKALDRRGGNPHLAPEIAEALKTARQKRGLSKSWCDDFFCGGTTNWSWFEGRPAGQRIPSVEIFNKIVKEWAELAPLANLVAEVEREITGRQIQGKLAVAPGQNSDRSLIELDITAPATPLAKQFDGYGSALKPAGEPVLLFRRPREGRTFAQCAREFGSGGLNISSCRVNAHGEYLGRPKGQSVNCYEWSKRPEPMKGQITSEPAGRWPPNAHFSHTPHHSPCSTCYGDGCDDCRGEGAVGGCVRVGTKRVRGSSPTSTRGSYKTSNLAQQGAEYILNEIGQGVSFSDPDGKETIAAWDCVENCAVRLLGEMSGESPSNLRKNKGDGAGAGMFGVSGGDTQGHNDSGTAARFFVQHDWSYEIAERLAGETPFKYCAKSSRGERDAGCTTLHDKKTVLGDGFNSATKIRTDKQAINGVDRGQCKNPHPTVKPISLIKWLATLCKPPDQFKPRICIPYAGSGSEVIGAILAGWGEIHAIEREPEYCKIAAARIAWWSKWAKLTGKVKPAEIRKLGEAAEEKESWHNDERQRSMFEVL